MEERSVGQSVAPLDAEPALTITVGHRLDTGPRMASSDFENARRIFDAPRYTFNEDLPSVLSIEPSIIPEAIRASQLSPMAASQHSLAQLTAENDQIRAQSRHVIASQATEIDQLRAELASMDERLRALEGRRHPEAGPIAASPAPAATDHPQAADERSDLVGHFIDLVRELPQTRQILLEETEEGSRVWTIIETEPFDRSQREPIYQAQGEVLRSHPPADVYFRLVNISEFGTDRIAGALPHGAQTLWVRQG